MENEIKCSHNKIKSFCLPELKSPEGIRQVEFIQDLHTTLFSFLFVENV